MTLIGGGVVPFLKAAVNTIVPRSPFFFFLYLKISTVVTDINIK